MEPGPKVCMHVWLCGTLCVYAGISRVISYSTLAMCSFVVLSNTASVLVLLGA